MIDFAIILAGLGGVYPLEPEFGPVRGSRWPVFWCGARYWICDGDCECDPPVPLVWILCRQSLFWSELIKGVWSVGQSKLF